jgi:cobyrinic acid a,c-diamide synthase
MKKANGYGNKKATIRSLNSLPRTTGFPCRCTITGIKDEAIGKYFALGEMTVEMAAKIEKLTSDFQVLYEHNIDVWKMLDIAKEIKDLSNQLEYCAEKIADSSKKISIDTDSLHQMGYMDKDIEKMKLWPGWEIT